MKHNHEIRNYYWWFINDNHDDDSMMIFTFSMIKMIMIIIIIFIIIIIIIIHHEWHQSIFLRQFPCHHHVSIIIEYHLIIWDYFLSYCDYRFVIRFDKIFLTMIPHSFLGHPSSFIILMFFSRLPINSFSLLINWSSVNYFLMSNSIMIRVQSSPDSKSRDCR